MENERNKNFVLNCCLIPIKKWKKKKGLLNKQGKWAVFLMKLLLILLLLYSPISPYQWSHVFFGYGPYLALNLWPLPYPAYHNSTTVYMLIQDEGTQIYVVGCHVGGGLASIQIVRVLLGCSKESGIIKPIYWLTMILSPSLVGMLKLITFGLTSLYSLHQFWGIFNLASWGIYWFVLHLAWIARLGDLTFLQTVYIVTYHLLTSFHNAENSISIFNGTSSKMQDGDCSS